MATERPKGIAADVDSNASPFELQPIDGLPLTKAERIELARMLAALERERATVTTPDVAPDGASSR